MPSTRIEVAREIAQPLHQLERSIDAALADIAALTGVLARSSQKARVSAIVGQGVFDDIGRTHAALTAARGHTVAAHLTLDELRAQLRLPVTAVGDESEKVPAFTQARHLASVA